MPLAQPVRKKVLGRRDGEVGTGREDIMPGAAARASAAAQAGLPGRARACNDARMKQSIWYLLFVVMLFVSYQGYMNAQDDPETEAMARDAVCAVDKDCGIAVGAQAGVRKTDIMSRNYQWSSKSGSYVATCTREYKFLGHWSCVAQPGQIGR